MAQCDARVPRQAPDRPPRDDLPDGGAAGAALVDSSEMAGAVARLRDRGFMDEVPEQFGGLPDSLASMAKARELAEAWKVARLRVNQVEFAQMKGRAATLAGLLRNRTAAAHVERLGAAITATSALLPNASSDQVATWVRERQRLEPRLAGELAAVDERLLHDVVGLHDEYRVRIARA